MATSEARAERLHQRVFEQIPWHVNGTLGAAERQIVDEHAATCARCRAEIAAERELARAVKGAEAVAPSPHPVQLARLLARIDAHEAALALPEESAADRPAATAAITGDDAFARRSRAALFEPMPRRLRQLLVAELAAILVLAVALAWHLKPAAPRETAAVDATGSFTVLSSDQVVVPRGTAAIRLLFDDGVTAKRMVEILTRVHGQIASGPTPTGTYVVTVPSRPGDDPVDLVIAQLKAQPGVTWAGPVAGAGER